MIKKHIPNALTCLNLAFGFWGILLLVYGKAEWATYCIGGSLIADFLDGFVARLLHVSSPIGKELDSLADMVSFGVLPALMLVFMIAAWSSAVPYSDITSKNLFEPPVFTWYLLIGTLPALFSGIRLAKFNIDTRQGDRFYGIPTPTNAIIVAAFNLIALDSTSFLYPLATNLWFILLYCAGMSYLLISELPLMALKFKSFGWAENKFRFLLLGISLISILLTGKESVPIIVLAYIVLSALNMAQEKKNTSGIE